MKATKSIEVLFVEDDPGDIELTRAALGAAKLDLNIHVVEDGERALAYLRGEPPYADAVRPDIVILDLNLPRRDGREVLSEMKRDPSLQSIPVVVLTTSSAGEDVERSYASGANCFVTKPLGFPEFKKVVHCLSDFWFTVVSFPSGATGWHGTGD